MQLYAHAMFPFFSDFVLKYHGVIASSKCKLTSYCFANTIKG